VKLTWRGVNGLLLATNAGMFTAEGHLIAFAPLQLRELGLTDAEVAVWSGLLFAVTTATSLPLGPIWGVLAERYSRRAIILRSQLVLTASLLVAAWAPDLAFVVLARAMMGLSFGTGGVIVAVQAMVTPPRQVGRAIALVQASQPIAGSIGPPLGAMLIPQLGLRGLFMVDAVLMLVTVAVTAWLLPEPTGGLKPTSILGRVGEVVKLAWGDTAIRGAMLAQTLTRGATAVVETYLPVRIVAVAEDPAAAIGFILGAFGACTTLAAWVISRIADRIDLLRTYTISMAVGGALAVGLALAPRIELIAALAILRAAPTACSRTLLWMHLARVVPREHQTGVFNLLPTAGNSGGLTFPLVAAALASLGTSAALLFGAATHAACVVAGARLRSRQRADGRGQ
jgi:DHA1 family multidrug resistance protein-like MFS transporter